MPCSGPGCDAQLACVNREPVSAASAIVKSRTVSRGYAKYTPGLTEKQLRLRDGLHGMSRAELKKHMASLSGGTEGLSEDSDSEPRELH